MGVDGEQAEAVVGSVVHSVNATGARTGRSPTTRGLSPGGGGGQTPDVKIAFVGSFSTGKTTLADLFAKEWDLPLLPEVAREVVKLGFPLDMSATAETETLIFLKQWRAEAVHDKFVADRSIYDVLAYADWVMEHNDADRKENHLWYESREIALLDLRARYDDVFYLPIEFPIVLDGLRPDDTTFQADIDRRIVTLLHDADVRFTTLTGTVEDPPNPGPPPRRPLRTSRRLGRVSAAGRGGVRRTGRRRRCAASRANRP